MTEHYHVFDQQDSPSLDSAALASFLAKDGQLLLPMLNLIETAQGAIDDLIDVMGRTSIEAVLLMSAQHIAGTPKQQRKKTERVIVYHTSQAGRVALRARQLRVEKPRLRRKNPQAGEYGEVVIPAYEAPRKDGCLADRMLEFLINGVFAQRYERVLPEMPETVGVSKSEASRETVEAGQRLLKKLAVQDSSKLDFLAVWIDGIQLSSYHVICGVGAVSEGHKHVSGLRDGDTEIPMLPRLSWKICSNAVVDPKRRRLFVIDGWKALRMAIDLVFGEGTPVQRCRYHKLRNVLVHLREHQRDQAESSFKLDAKEGEGEFEQCASWIELDWPSAASSLRGAMRYLRSIGLVCPARCVVY